MSDPNSREVNTAEKVDETHNLSRQDMADVNSADSSPGHPVMSEVAQGSVADESCDWPAVETARTRVRSDER